MAKISFTKSTEAADETASKPVAEVEAVVAPPAPAVSVPALRGPQSLSSNTLSDDDQIDLTQITLPKLNIVQRIGLLSTQFKPEDILLNRTLVLPQPVEVVVIAFRPRDQYAEKTTDGDTGRLFDTKEEVASVGGTTDYNMAQASGKPLFRPLATIALLVKRDASIKDSSLFTHEIDGGHWGFCLWSTVGSVYTHAAKVFRTAKLLGTECDLRGGYANGRWELRSRVEKHRNGNLSIIPVLKGLGPTSEAFRVAAKALVSALTGKP